MTSRLDEAPIEEPMKYTNTIQLRENKEKFNPVKDLSDWTTLDRPAQGAHNDVTYGSGPTQLNAHLPDDVKEKYLRQKGYRFRIVKYNLTPYLSPHLRLIVL
jgi:hypothetical protein